MPQPNDIILINKFPDYQATGFDEARHDQQFLHNNVIIRAEAKEVYFPDHWGPLSIKCCIDGTEHYAVGPRCYRVNPDNFLVLNEGQYYSSHIHSKEKVASFTINFSREMVREVAGCLSDSDDGLLTGLVKETGTVEFVERLRPRKGIARILEKLKRLSASGLQQKGTIRETMILLLEHLIALEKETTSEIKKVNALKS